MMMGYSRLGKYDDARRSMLRILDFARRFRMDNPLVDFGGAVYQPHQPINCCYDTFGAPAALIRGLFEYLYRADALTIVPHIPTGIVELEQRFAVRFGPKRLYLSTVGRGPVTAVLVNGRAWTSFDAKSIMLPYDKTPDAADVRIALGDAKLKASVPRPPRREPPLSSVSDSFWRSDWLTGVLGPTPLPLRIGADSKGSSRFVGDIGRASVFGRELSAQEVAALARNDTRALDGDAALVGDWRLGDLDGARLSAKIVDKAEIVDVPAGQGPGGRALRLSGEGYVEVAHSPKLVLTDAYTLTAWVRPKKLPSGGGRILDKSTVGTSDNFLLDTHPGNSLRLITRRGHVGFRAGLPVDTWSHVAATFSAAGELRLYVNGKQVASQPAEADTVVDSIEPLRAAYERIRRLYGRLTESGLADGYEAAHARLAIESVATLQARRQLLVEGKIPRLSGVSQKAADKSYAETAAKLCHGLARVLDGYDGLDDPRKRRIHQLWRACTK